MWIVTLLSFLRNPVSLKVTMCRSIIVLRLLALKLYFTVALRHFHMITATQVTTQLSQDPIALWKAQLGLWEIC